MTGSATTPTSSCTASDAIARRRLASRRPAPRRPRCRRGAAGDPPRRRARQRSRGLPSRGRPRRRPRGRRRRHFRVGARDDERDVTRRCRQDPSSGRGGNAATLTRALGTPSTARSTRGSSASRTTSSLQSGREAATRAATPAAASASRRRRARPVAVARPRGALALQQSREHQLVGMARRRRARVAMPAAPPSSSSPSETTRIDGSAADAAANPSAAGRAYRTGRVLWHVRAPGPGAGSRVPVSRSSGPGSIADLLSRERARASWKAARASACRPAA